MVSEKFTSHVEPPAISSRRSGVKEPIKGRKMTLWNRAEGTIDLEGNEGERNMEELFWTLEDEPSELAKTAKFVSGLLPSLNRKLCGKEYSWPGTCS